MRVALQPSFILHARPFQDTSLILDLLTLEHGRIHAIARSARGGRSRFKGILQPFVPFLASWSGKTDLVYLNKIETNGLPFYLTGTALISGFYLNELLVRLLHREDAHPNIYKAYQLALTGLAFNNNPEQQLRLFEKQLLDELGYGIQLTQDISGEKILENQFYQFQPERGFAKTHHSEIQATLFYGKSLLALHREDLQDQQDLQATKKLMRLLLTPLLGEKPIKSRELFVRE